MEKREKCNQIVFLREILLLIMGKYISYLIVHINKPQQLQC